MAHEDGIEVEGQVMEILSPQTFRVQLPNGHQVTGHLSGKMRETCIRVLPGDAVVLKVSAYDFSQGRILHRQT
jgi:translation initiation factor IF-1